MLSTAELMSCERVERARLRGRERIITRNSSTSAHCNAHFPMDGRARPPPDSALPTGNLWYAERLINKVRHNGRGAGRNDCSLCPGRRLKGILDPCDRV